MCIFVFCHKTTDQLEKNISITEPTLFFDVLHHFCRSVLKNCQQKVTII